MNTEFETYYNDYWVKTDGHWSPCDLPLLETERTLIEREVKEGMEVLDVGCGDGRTAALVSSLGASYKGVDLSETAVAQLRGRGLDTRVHDLTQPLPFPDRQFQAAVIFEVLEHLFRPDRCVADLRRVIAPGGVLLGSVPNSVCLGNRALTLAGHFNPAGSPETSLRAPWRDPHVRFFTKDTIQRMMLEAGFHKCTVEGGAFSTAHLPVLWKRPPRAMPERLINPWIARLGRWMPSVFSHRLYFTASA